MEVMKAQTISLNGTWQVQATDLAVAGEDGCAQLAPDAGEWLPAEVPGEIHLDLMRAGKMQAPEISDNARGCRWPEGHAWWFTTTFELSDEFVRHERQRLVFDAIDLCAQVFLNGRQVGTSCNGYVPAVLDVRDAVRAGANELVVRVTSGMELLPDEEGGIFSGIYEGRNTRARRHLRKPQYTFGWDWTDPLPNIGIWRPVHLEGRSGAVIDGLRLDTVMQGDQVRLEGQAVLENLHPSTARSCVLEISVAPPEGETIVQRHELPLPPGLSDTPLSIPIPAPKLWWPNGMGDQPLYQVTGRVLIDDEECDRTTYAVGLRTIEIDCSALPDGERFDIKVNGEAVFCRGANWGPPDMIPARVTPERYATLVAEAKDAHFTMFRVNGVGIYDDDAFFDACDRAGILIWQDFMFACAEYPDYEDQFRAAVKAEATAVIRRLRHHASLAVWCGCNECQDGMYKRRVLHAGPVEKDYYGWDDRAGTILYDEVLPDLCERLDPHRPYRHSSPYGGPFPNSETHGMCHWWRSFFMSDDVNRRIRPEVFEECRARFVAEYGIIGPCHADSIRDYLKPGELSRGSPAWDLHTNTFERGTLPEAIRYHYTDPQGLSTEEFSLYGQLYQGLMHEHAMCSLRFRKCDRRAPCSGALVWSYGDCWGETGWSIIDHYLRRKASYYFLRRACSPVKVIVRPQGEHLATRVVNDTRQSYSAAVCRGWFRVDGTARDVTETRVELPANAMVEIGSDSTTQDRRSGQWVYGAVLTAEGLPDDQCVWMPVPFRDLALSAPDIRVTREGNVAENVLEVVSPVFCHGVHVADGGHELLSDNFFDLLPGVPRRMRVSVDPGQIDLRCPGP